MKRSDMTLQEWLDWRKIGASDAAVIMGCSPFKTLRRLYEERVEGQQVFVSKAMEHGNFCESAILYEIEGAHEAAWGPMEQQVCISSDTHPFLTATLDGWFADEGVVVEVKATQLKAYQAMREADAVPLHYWCQLQHQMYVADARMGLFAAEDPETHNVWIKEVYPDPEWVKAYLPKAQAFWEMIVNQTPPPDDYVDKSDDEEWAILAILLKDIKEERAQIKKFDEELAKKEASIKEAAIKIAGGVNTQGLGMRLNFVQKLGSLDDKAMKADGIDIEKYRKPSTELITLNFNRKGDKSAV